MPTRRGLCPACREEHDFIEAEGTATDAADAPVTHIDVICSHCYYIIETIPVEPPPDQTSRT